MWQQIFLTIVVIICKLLCALSPDLLARPLLKNLQTPFYCPNIARKTPQKVRHVYTYLSDAGSNSLDRQIWRCSRQSECIAELKYLFHNSAPSILNSRVRQRKTVNDNKKRPLSRRKQNCNSRWGVTAALSRRRDDHRTGASLMHCMWLPPSECAGISWGGLKGWGG